MMASVFVFEFAVQCIKSDVLELDTVHGLYVSSLYY